MKRLFIRILWLPLLTVLCGCHPAVLVIPSYIRTIGVQPVDNRTSYYGLDTTLTQDLIRELQVDGRVSLEDPDKADMVIKVVLNQFVIEPQMYDPHTNAVLEYRLSLVYDVSAFDAQAKKTFMEETKQIHSIYYYPPNNTAAGTITQTQDQARAQLSDDLALILVRRVLEGQ